MRHGPYHRLCVGMKDRKGTFFVRGEDAEAVGRMCAAFQEAKELLSDIALTTMDLWRDAGVGKVAEAVPAEPGADLPRQPAPSSQAKLEASRDKWKSRAKERHVEIEAGRIKNAGSCWQQGEVARRGLIGAQGCRRCQ